MFNSTSNLVEIIASGEVIDQAFNWLCKQRIKYSANSDIWHLRYNWEKIKPQLQAKLLAGDYLFRPIRPYFIDGETIFVWQAEDALVLKAITIVLTDKLKPVIKKSCYHVKGHGGLNNKIVIPRLDRGNQENLIIKK